MADLDTLAQTAVIESDKEKARKAILSVQDQIFRAHMDVVMGMGKFAEIDEDHDVEKDGLPKGWVKEYGEEQAKQMYRIAKASWRSKSEAPVALDQSVKIVTSIIKAKATERGSNNNTINVAAVVMTPAGEPPPQLPVIDIDATD